MGGRQIWNRVRWAGYFLLTLCALCGLPAWGKEAPPSYVTEMRRIANADELSSKEKIARLQPYVLREDSRQSALAILLQIDRHAAHNAALVLFRKDGMPQSQRIELGRFLMHSDPPQQFPIEYARFLIAAVLAGEKEYMAVREIGTITAVGEYADIAACFNGYQREQFGPMKDARVIPVLTRCLQAPDEVRPRAQGDLVSGEPEKPTGRSIGRQNIPSALARLGATSAIPSLRSTLRAHHDYYLRSNCAYALGYLLPRKEIPVVEAEIIGLNGRDVQQFLFPFGRGLIEHGNADGIKYLAFRYSAYYQLTSPTIVLYMLEERLAVLKDFRHTQTEGFYREALTHAPLRALFLLNETPGQIAESRARIVDAYIALLDGIRANRLITLAPLVKEIGMRTASPEIRNASQGFLKEIETAR